MCPHLERRTCDINHMDYTCIWMLGCAVMCQHLDSCRNVGRCQHLQHIYVPTCSDTWDTNLMDILVWMMGCTGMCQHLESWRHMRSYQQVLTYLGADMCWHLGYQSYGSFYLDTEKCWHVSIPEKVPTRADTFKCRHVPVPVILIMWTLFGYWDVLTCASTWKGADTWEGADTTCWHVPTQLGADNWDTNYMDSGMCWHL